jgi:hypothetical protein
MFEPSRPGQPQPTTWADWLRNSFSLFDAENTFRAERVLDALEAVCTEFPTALGLNEKNSRARELKQVGAVLSVVLHRTYKIDETRRNPTTLALVKAIHKLQSGVKAQITADAKEWADVPAHDAPELQPEFVKD